MKKISGSEVSKTEGLSRRTMLGGAALVAGLGATAVMSTSAQAAKVPQKSANYQDSPKGSSKCETCSQFQGPDACKVVEGKVSPNGWCQLYAPKAG